ncbi:hypothetical protein LEMLEM_LOCUS1482, partial [Lemmus lemmus]
FFFRRRRRVWNGFAVLELALVDQAGLKLTDLPASTSRVLGLNACATTTWLAYHLADGWSSDSSTHTGSLTTTCNSSSRES